MNLIEDVPDQKKKRPVKHINPTIDIGAGVLFDYAEGHGSKEFQEKLRQAGINYELIAVDGLKARDYRVYHNVLPWFFIQGVDGGLRALGGHGAILTFIESVSGSKILGGESETTAS